MLTMYYSFERYNFPSKLVQGIIEFGFEEKKISPISANGSRDVSFPAAATHNPMVCEICNGTEAELYILYVKGISPSRLISLLHVCSLTKLLCMILDIYRGRSFVVYMQCEA